MSSSRLTLISCNHEMDVRDWNTAPASTRFIAADSMADLRYGLAGIHAAIERVIFDRTVSVSEYLSLLASLPTQFAGDVLFIDEDDSGFLSALAPSGDRILDVFSPVEIRFYLDTMNEGELAAAA